MTRHAPAEQRLLVVAGIVWLDGERVIVQRRSHTAAHGSGRLELPGGKVEPGEPPALALARELVEEWGEAARVLEVGPIADVLHHIYPPPGREVVLLVYHVDARSLATGANEGANEGTNERASVLARLTPEAGASAHVFDRAELPSQEFLDADRPCVDQLRRARLRCPWSA